MTYKLLIDLGRKHLDGDEFSIRKTWNLFFFKSSFVSLRSILEFLSYNYTCFIIFFIDVLSPWALLKMDSSLP